MDKSVQSLKINKQSQPRLHTLFRFAQQRQTLFLQGASSWLCCFTRDAKRTENFLQVTSVVGPLLHGVLLKSTFPTVKGFG
jgi:hypothetical protein